MPAPAVNPPLSWKVDPLPTDPKYINSVGISADGSKVVTGTYYFDYSANKHPVIGSKPFQVGVFAYDKLQNLLWKDQFQALEGVYWVAVSRDGNWASAGGLGMTNQGFISAYDMNTGVKAFEYATDARTNWVAMNADGSVLVAGVKSIFVFARNATGWNANPQIINSPIAQDTIVSVAVSADGKWIIAGTVKGVIMLIDNSGAAPKPPVCWSLAGATFHWMAMSADGGAFAAAGSGSSVYYFKTNDFIANQKPSWAGPLSGSNSCRSVAISDDGATISAVGNVATAGALFVFDQSGNLKWKKPTAHNPNSTSIDSSGKFVTVADGYPDGKPGSFSLFDQDGSELWNYASGNMSWPMSIAANASAIAAGSDDSFLYYFTNP